jgi:predicted MFS family arabinose efflux permease
VLPDALPWWGLLALSTAAFTDVMTDLLPAGLLPQMSSALHVPEARIGLLVSAFAMASALAAIPVTAMLRSLPRRPVLIAVLAGFGLFDAVTAVSPWYSLTFLARLAAGVMGGTLWSMLAGYAARMVPAGQRGRAIAPLARGRTSLALLVFGGATVAGLWITGIVADRYLRPALLAALATMAVAMLVLGLAARQPAMLLTAVALWGAAFGGAPTLLQTALVDASGPARADVATALQTTVYNIGIAAGSLAGGLVLGGAGAASLPWVTLAFAAAALGTVALVRRDAFPARRDVMS